METNRLLLIPIDVEIIDALNESNKSFYVKYGYKNEGGEYLNPSPNYLHKIKSRLLDHPEEYPLAVDYLIIVKDIKTVIGTIYYKYLPQDGVSEIGYGMNPKFEGNGYMSEALTKMLEFGKENGIKIVKADTLKTNIKSQNVLYRSGFLLEKREEELMYFIKIL